MPLINLLKNKIRTLSVFAFAIFFITCFSLGARASAIDDLKQEIENYNNQIKDLEQKTAEYQQNLNETAQKKQTLQSEVSGLNNELYSLNINVDKTKKEIAEANLTINLLGDEIGKKLTDMDELRTQMASAMQLIYEKDKTNLFYVMMSSKDFSKTLSEKEYLSHLENGISYSLARIKTIKVLLEESKSNQETKRASLVGLQAKLSDQLEITSGKQQEKNSLLKDTKNEEAQYQKILSDLNKQRNSVEKEIGNLETKLQAAIQREKLPKEGKGSLYWPLEKFSISQGYGWTKYAKAGAYGGSIHNGVDMAAPTGTPIYAPASGVIIGVGNDGKYAYGKWIAIQHDNNLITLYGHTSLQKVSEGQRVSPGDLLGYVGATGYATGPHLHFTVYAPDSFGLRQSSVVSWLKIPFGAPLNPYDYLPDKYPWQ